MDRNMEEMRKSDGCLNPEIYPYQNQKDFTKGGVRKIKMEIKDGICHEGGGSRLPLSYFEK